ncbi:MAG: DUF2461 domain-containing protein [Bacteroidota bacterium]|nr:DUF2461 domain-containing protein [Bacteroidota bacterium]
MKNQNKATIKKSTFIFLKDLGKHNNRDWFNKHKDRYLAEQENMLVFAENLLEMMHTHDEIENASAKNVLYRIYKDVRFSKDKSPYKTSWSGSFRRATKLKRGGYHFHIEPGNSYMSGGFYGPGPDDLKRIRQDIDRNNKDWKKLLGNKKTKSFFGELRGARLLTTPKGFDKDHPAIDLLRYKSFVLRHNFTDKEVLSDNFPATLNQAFKNLRPFFDYMSDVLTTDLNGISLVE